MEVFRNGVSMGTVTAATDGSWTYDCTGTPLPEGALALTATATDAAGNTSGVSPALNVIIDVTAPSKPWVVGITDDSGLAGDGITSDQTLEIYGTAEPWSGASPDCAVASTSVSAQARTIRRNVTHVKVIAPSPPFIPTESVRAPLRPRPWPIRPPAPSGNRSGRSPSAA